MGISDDLKNIAGIVTVEIEGFFTERFINLCKINNIKIFDIRNIVKGVVRFKMNISEFKKLRKIARKTKCKVKIKSKDGLYFKLFKYRKRKFAVILFFMVVIFSIAFSTFIWNIEISGNNYISSDDIRNALEQSGVYVGKNKIGLDKKQVINNLRINLNDISWAGIDISGTTLKLEVVEKTKIDEDQIQNNSIGDIVANKSGIITKIVPENGTAKFKVGSYVEENMVVIEGKIYSKFLDPVDVPAKGIVNIESNYNFEKEYKYVNLNKEFTGKKIYTVGITINSNEIMVNYLNKNKKYDISKNSKTINIFGKTISFDFYECSEYNEVQYTKNKDELIEEGKNESKEFIDSALSSLNDGKVVNENTEIIEQTDGIYYKTNYVVNERIGKFVERTKNEQFTY